MRVVIEEVLHKWQLSHDKMITTDSGSNMVAAFHSHLAKGCYRRSNTKEQEKE